MKKIVTTALIFTLSVLSLAGCRKTNAPTSVSTTGKPASSAATQTTLLPAPEITLPMDTEAPLPSETGVPETSTSRPASRRPRY